MQWSELNLSPPPRVLRQFAGLWVVCIAALACWHGLVHERHALGVALAVLAFTIGPVGLVWPAAIRPVYAAALVVTFPIGWVVSRVVLACLFYGLFTPVGLLFRLVGRDALGIRRRPDRETYWEDKPTAADAASYLRQF